MDGEVVQISTAESGNSFLPKNSRRPDPRFEQLMKAFHAKDISKLREFSSLGLPVDYREPAKKLRTPLLYAAKCDFFEGVCELLEQGADPNLADSTGATPLHSAAINANVRPLKKLVKVVSNIDQKDVHGRTALHCASQAITNDSNGEDVFRVVDCLLNAGAQPSVKDSDERTPLHVAALSGNANLIPLLLYGRGNCLLSARDSEGKTPLHYAVLGARSLLAVKILLEHESPIDAKDNQGFTPLHHVTARPINYVDEEFDGECLELLLAHGASVAAKDEEGQNALSLALRKTMWWSRYTPRDVILHSVQTLVAKGSAITDSFAMWRMVETFPSLVMVALNQSIRANTSAKDSPHLKLKLDVRPLTQRIEKHRLHNPSSPPDELKIPPPLLEDSEMSMLHYILWAGHKNILRHPLCSAFLHLKWLKVRKYFIFNAIFHLIFVLSFTFFILTMSTCTINSDGTYSYKFDGHTKNSYIKGPLEENYLITDLRHCTWLMLLFFSVILVLRELFQLFNSPGIYLTHYENYLDITMIVCVIILISSPGPCLKSWQDAVGSIAAVTSWSRLMLFLGHFPSCGVYIVMFSTVCRTVIRFLAIYLPLLLAFTLGFYILLNGVSTFSTFPISIVSSLVMMTGEMEYSDNVLNNENITSKVLAFAVLVLFILLIYIILSNLLVALAVSDMSTIQQRSELLRLTRQVELMVQAERFVKSPFIPRRFRHFLKKTLSVTGGHSDRLFTILPNRRRGLTETLYEYISRIFQNKRVLTKIFEHFVSGFIPPDPEPSLPKGLLQETTQMALTELEIDKRDKRLCLRSQQANMLRHRMAKKKNANQNQNVRGRPMATQYIQWGSLLESRTRAILNDNWYEDPDVGNLIPCARQQGGPLNSTPSLRASLWRASFRKGAHLQDKHSAFVNEETAAMKEEVVALRKTISSLQFAVENLMIRFPRKKIPFERRQHRRSFPFQKPLLKTKESSRMPHSATHSIQELRVVEKEPTEEIHYFSSDNEAKLDSKRESSNDEEELTDTESYGLHKIV